MLLAIDIGNSHIVFGLFQRETLLCEFRMATQLQKTADEYGVLFKNILSHWKASVPRINGVILSSVVPILTPVFEEMSRNYFSTQPILAAPSLTTGITVAYRTPSEVGADRIVNAAAAVHFFGREGRPLIIVDFGTATTFDLVSAEGVYFGGAIAPGLVVSSAALSSHTAKLPVVELAVPENVIGENTVSSMQSGLLFGHAGLVNEIVGRMTREIPRLIKPGPRGRHPPPKVIATGGLARFIAPLCKVISLVRPALTLEGLMIIYQRNRPTPLRSRKARKKVGHGS